MPKCKSSHKIELHKFLQIKNGHMQKKKKKKKNEMSNIKFFRKFVNPIRF